MTEFAGTTNGGNLVTAGDVVFQAIGREFYAVNARTGEKLAQVTMEISTFSTPMGYMAGGGQYPGDCVGWFWSWPSDYRSRGHRRHE